MGNLHDSLSGQARIWLYSPTCVSNDVASFKIAGSKTRCGMATSPNMASHIRSRFSHAFDDISGSVHNVKQIRLKNRVSREKAKAESLGNQCNKGQSALIYGWIRENSSNGMHRKEFINRNTNSRSRGCYPHIPRSAHR
jgi:hypothetical protein